MDMLTIDADRGRTLATLLYDKFSTNGILGSMQMPEDILPKGVERGSLEHVLFITLTVSIDYQRNADSLWEASRKTFEDPETRYLFYPEEVHKVSSSVIVRDMVKHRLAKKPKKDANIWRTNALTFLKKYDGSPLAFLERCDFDAPNTIEKLISGRHEYNGRNVLDFPFLRGSKIGPLWIRMLRDNTGIELKRMDKLFIPVDVHVARATVATGVVHGHFSGSLEELHQKVRDAWKESVFGLCVGTRPMIALDIDEPLWHLSKNGCTFRTTTGECPHIARCEAREFCIKGRVIVGSKVDIDT